MDKCGAIGGAGQILPALAKKALASAGILGYNAKARSEERAEDQKIRV